MDAAVAECGDRRIKRVVLFVKKDLTKRCPLSAAAEIAGLEAAYFSRLFRKTTGQTFNEWNARVRMEEAKAQLRIVDLSITAIAASVGYEDLTTFERVFRRSQHLCPRQYRAQELRRFAERQETPIRGQEVPRP